MPWLSIIVWLVSYFLQTKNGVSAGKAALTSTALGLGTYYLADPANTKNILGFSWGDTKPTAGNVSGATAAVTRAAGATTGSSIVSEVGSTLRSWGPTGTMGVIATTTGAATDNKWLLYGGLAVVALLILK